VDIVQKSLDSAEDTWREIIRTEYPLFFHTPVVKAPADPKNKRHWMFYTDSKTTHMDVFQPELIETIFRTCIVPLYKNAYGNIAAEKDIVGRFLHDTFTYLYFHEQFHPTFCPDSTEDEKLVDKALYEGIQKADPNNDPKSILSKVGNVRNAAWDQVIDQAFFFLSGNNGSLEDRITQVFKENEIPPVHFSSLPDAVVPLFDVIEFHQYHENFESLYYPLSRAVYGFLFTRKAEMRKIIFDYFKKRTIKQMREQEFDDVLKKVLKGFVAELSPREYAHAQIDKNEFEKHVEHAYGHYGEAEGEVSHQYLNEHICFLLLDKRTRYAALKGFIQPFAKYISLVKEEKRHGSHISGSSSGDAASSINQEGGNTEQALQNLANILGPAEGNALLAAISNSGGAAQKDKRLSNLARDEYYKRNAKEIAIRSPDYRAVHVVLGKRKVPYFVSSQMIPIEEVPNLPLESILRFQQDTGITQLFEVSDFEFRFDIYDWHEVDDTDYTFENMGVEIPDNIIFHNDSSGSMGNPNYVGTKSPYDVLMHLDFGLLKTLRRAAVAMKKDPLIIAANFSNGTIVSEATKLSVFYDSPNNSTKNVLTGFQNGGTDYTASAFADIRKKCGPGKTVHLWATDGALNLGCQEATFRAIEETVRMPQTSFLYFEIGTKTAFGERIKILEKQYPMVKTYLGVSLESLQKSALEILIQYEGHSVRDLI